MLAKCVVLFRSLWTSKNSFKVLEKFLQIQFCSEPSWEQNEHKTNTFIWERSVSKIMFSFNMILLNIRRGASPTHNSKQTIAVHRHGNVLSLNAKWIFLQIYCMILQYRAFQGYKRGKPRTIILKKSFGVTYIGFHLTFFCTSDFDEARRRLGDGGCHIDCACSPISFLSFKH